MSSGAIFVDCTSQSSSDGVRATQREGARFNLQNSITGGLRELSGNPTAVMWYAAKYYAANVVVKQECKLVGWPASIPFTSISEIRGGVPPLLELQRRWNLPDGDPEKLRFERATSEDIANAMRDPESVHPNSAQLQAEKLKAAAARAEPEAKAAAQVIPVCTYHPDDLSFLGLELTSTTPDVDPEAQRSQRVDYGRRRKRKSDGSLQVRKRLPKDGIKSARCVIPGVKRKGRAVGKAAKRVRLDDRAVDDPIDRFVLSTEFGGSLSGMGV
ncbi:hypothetical protein VTO73DRAFT_11554 [Trametes versicolor]